MARYSIDEQTLTKIGDAIRSHVGETKPSFAEAIYEYVGQFTGYTYWNPDQINVPGASSVSITIHEATSTDNGWYYYKVAGGNYGSYHDEGMGKEHYTDKLPQTYHFDNTDTISIGYYHGHGDSSYSHVITATAVGYDADGNILVNKPIEVLNAFTPEQMADVISDLAVVPDEAFHITGDCTNRFANGIQDWLINSYGDRMTTNKLTNASNMFKASQVKSILFELNFGASSNGNKLDRLFTDCESLTEIPKINYAKPSTTEELFYGCRNLRYIPEDIETWFDWSIIDKATGTYSNYRGRHTFHSCYSLRSIPMGFLNHNNPYATTSSSYNLFYGLFNSCSSLDEIVGLPLARASEMKWTSNNFSNTFSSCSRLKNMTFATNEDGSPIVANWKSQTIDLSSYVGYSNVSSYFTAYNSGITADKEVKDDATYQALKNDPDWFSCNVSYSRYNHDSAVATINSLPDTTSSGGTNTIKFKGASGSATDGGAINTLTAEEIAVATAKGWTVSLV
jgi:hypothetical protein